MKPIIFTLLLLLSCKLVHTQVERTTGGCEYNGQIVQIDPYTYPDTVLVDAGSYSIEVELEAEMADCDGIISIKLGSLLIGSLHVPWSEADGHIITIPLNILDVPPGSYVLSYLFDPDIDDDIMATERVNVVQTTGINNVNETHGISIYPLPAHDVLNIKMLNSQESINEIKMINANGTLVKTIHLSSSETAMAVNGIPTGMYILQVQTSDRLLNEKVLIGN